MIARITPEEQKTIPNIDLNDVVMDCKEAAAFLRITTVTLHQLKDKGLVKYHCLCRKTTFLKSELLEAVHNS